MEKIAANKLLVKLTIELIKVENCVMPTTETNCEEIFFVISSEGEIRLYRIRSSWKYCIGSLKLFENVSTLIPESKSACSAIRGTINQNIRKTINIIVDRVIRALKTLGNSSLPILMLFNNLTNGWPIIESIAATRIYVTIALKNHNNKPIIISTGITTYHFLFFIFNEYYGGKVIKKFLVFAKMSIHYGIMQMYISAGLF